MVYAFLIDEKHKDTHMIDKQRLRRLVRQHGLIPLNNSSEGQSLLATWMIRLLLESSSLRKSFFDEKKNEYYDDDVAKFLLLPGAEGGPHIICSEPCENEKDIEEEDSEPEVPATMKELESALVEKLVYFEERKPSTLVVHKNIDLLASRLDFKALDKLILAYAILTENSRVWPDLFQNHKVGTEQQFYSYLACMFEYDVHDVKRHLSRGSFLRQSGLVNIEKCCYEDAKFMLMDGIEEAMFAEHNTVNDLMSCFLVPSSRSRLSMEDYPHAKQHIEVMQSIISSALRNEEKGVNILMYGTPGTGKTELVKVLAEKLDLNLFEVKTEDHNGDAVKSSQRLSSYRLSQQLLAQDKESLLLFDEVEDVFPSRAFSFFGMEVKSGENKGWMNKTLEGNALPSIWVCNQVSQIDPAFLRRFDYVMELNTPPKSVRLNIVKSYFEGISIKVSFLERLAEHKQLSPAQIEKLSKVAERVNQVEGDLESTLEQVVNNSLKAMSLKPLATDEKKDIQYNLDYLNTNVDMPSLIKGLQRSKRGNICFYGAPGTGKTALAAYIAKQLDKPLLSKKASDILGMFVGQSEQNIAAMFTEAKEEGSVLVLDEADSLLRDRRQANQSWEVTQVNELLVQMENFEGLFICSTNLMDNLDQASLRRFAMKVEFKFLMPNQALNMLKKECAGKVNKREATLIQQMSNLAPGDFAAVKKRLDILAIEPTAASLLEGLAEEVVVKEGGVKPSIGFLH